MCTTNSRLPLKAGHSRNMLTTHIDESDYTSLQMGRRKMSLYYGSLTLGVSTTIFDKSRAFCLKVLKLCWTGFAVEGRRQLQYLSSYFAIIRLEYHLR